MEQTLTSTSTRTTKTLEVTYSRDRLLFRAPDSGVRAYTVEASFGASRGLLWIEHDDGRPARLIEASSFRTEYPGAERRATDR